MSLLRTAVRASVATRVIGSTHRRQQQRWAAQDAAAAAAGSAPPAAPAAAPVPAAAVAEPPAASAPAAGAGTASVIEQLTQLGRLRDSGVLTEAEFETQKQRVLAAG
ncbi:SHOCT domain-containing protein [Leucobacter sp.]